MKCNIGVLRHHSGFYLVIFIAAFLMSSVVVNASLDTQFFGMSPAILVNLVKQEPDPVEPGKQVEVTLKLDNNGTRADNVIFEIMPDYPFSLLPGESASNSIGALGSSQDGRYSVIVKYKLKTAQDAADGEYKIKVRYKSDNFDSWAAIDELKIRVQSHDSILAAEKFFTVPEVTAPGDKTKLRIELKNYATSLLKNIKVLLTLDKNGDEKIPFAPIGSTNEKVIPYIEGGATAPIEFELLADSDALSKAYKIPLTLTYSDILNKNYSKMNILTIIVGDKPDLGVALERTDLYTSESAGNVVIRIVNKGNPDIKFLNVKVLQNENLKIIGADEVYIGKLDSDDFSTAEFKVFVKGKDSIKIPVQIIYKDANNNYYKESREVELKLYSSSDAKTFGVKKSNSILWTAVAVVVLATGYYFYRRRKKKA